jgi:uncharacterized membrane protein
MLGVMREGSGDLLDLPADRGRLHALAAADVLDAAELERGLGLLHLRPARNTWGPYLYWHALILGVVLLAAGAIFFVAANWAALTALARLSIVGGAMVAATLAGGFLGDTLAGRSASLLGGLLFGPVLAVFGQTYQTGADPWELFALWTLVMLAYGVVVRFAGTAVLALVLAHISLFAFINQELGSDWYEGRGAMLVALMAVVDAVLVVLAERFAKGGVRRFLARVAAFFGLGILLPFGVLFVVGELPQGGLPGVIALALGLISIWSVYRWRRPDVVMLSAFAAMVTTLVSSAAAKIIFEDMDGELFGAALLGGLICAQVWAFTRWLLAWRGEMGQGAQAEHAEAEKGGVA